ncbi:putative endonuclease [Parabacteroides sp. PFB2-12]|uniref:YraN family protein n=1 Tax=unclassified Parabacteroides TaxID=2649774 RepID=UPI002474B039|nr:MULTISPECIES: YraN family protein [unclassified Parabacteroides]MDH6341472.1 putative endonuclease [Parabacteroides sp. PM6-13]MDH6389266.1 putative endonuclease [Parabacteroides sp. PFB2-12]
MVNRSEIGRKGEEIAREFLQKKGYTILDNNWHWHHFELDMVAIDGEWLVVVEVKTRAMDHLLSPEDAVDRKKIRRTVLAADAYARYFSIELPVRFDIVTVVPGPQGYEIEHYEDAFLPPVR